MITYPEDITVITPNGRVLQESDSGKSLWIVSEDERCVFMVMGEVSDKDVAHCMIDTKHQIETVEKKRKEQGYWGSHEILVFKKSRIRGPKR